MKVVHVDGTFEHWRAVARELLAQRAPPAEVAFSEEDPGGFLPGFAALPALAAEGTAIYAAKAGVPCAERVPAVFLSLARRVACHRDPSRWTRLYRVLWRVVHDDARVLQDPTDEEVAALDGMAEAVRQDIHRVHALVRFRRVEDASGDRYVAFHRPDHRTLRPAAPFFVHRFAGMRWSILTPDESAHWDLHALSFGPGVPRHPSAADDAEELWRAYYASTYNPARANPQLLRKHLPERLRASLPEGRDVDALIRAPARTRGPR